MKENVPHVTQREDIHSGNTHTLMSSNEPDFISLAFSVNPNKQIVLWKEQARLQQQWDGGSEKEYLKAAEQLLEQLKEKYGAPLGSVRLYDHGLVTLGVITDAVSEELSARSIKAGEEAWDEFYPEVAKVMSRISQWLLEKVNHQGTECQQLVHLSNEELHMKTLSTDGQCLSLGGKPVGEQLLRWMLEESGEALVVVEKRGLLGILTQRGMVITPFFIPYQKHRLARCISAVAKQVDAKSVLIVFEAYQSGYDGNRTSGVLLGTAFDPHGIARGSSMKYIRENGNFVLQNASEMRPLPSRNLCIRWQEGQGKAAA